MSIKMCLNPDRARQFINVLGAVLDEFRLQIGPDGWKVIGVDPANVVLTDVDFPKTEFISYEYEPEYEDILKVGVDVYKVEQFLGIAQDKPHIQLPEERSSPVSLTFSKAPDKGGRYQLEMQQGMFSRTILLYDEKELKKEVNNVSLKGLDYDLTLSGLEFRRIIEKSAEISDYITLGFERNNGTSEISDIVYFTANAIDDVEFPFNVLRHIHIWRSLREEARDSSRSMFSLDYLSNIVKIIPADKIRIHLGQDYPLRLLFPLGSTGQCKIMLAPRIDSE